MLRTRSPVRPLSHLECDAALELCARDLPANVFAASRVIEASRTGAFGSILAHVEDGELSSLCWASANVVPVETVTEDRSAYAERLRRWRSRCASVFGPREAVSDLWGQLEPAWGRPRAIRASQPLLATTTPPSALGVQLDPRVRPARPDEVDRVVPAAAHMFTAEIGYPPYSGSGRGYRSAVAGLISAGHTYVVVEEGEVIFKTDVGSLALGCAQLQGVWVTPRLRGHGLAAPMLATVVEHLMAGPAPMVCLYVNDFNAAARAAYARLGFTEVGEFTTILL